MDALTVDRRSNSLYLTYGHRLYEYNIADRSRRFLLEIRSERVLSLAVSRSFLYWLSREGNGTTHGPTQRIERVSVNVYTVSDRTIIIKHLTHVTDLITVDPVDDTYPKHPCSKANNHGNCSHLCLPSIENSKEAECGCPLTLQLDNDRRTCVDPPPSTTPEPNPVKGLEDCSGGPDESPNSCNTAKPVLTPVENNSNTQFVIAFAILASLVLVGGYFYIKQKLEDSSDNKNDIAVMRPLAMPTSVCQPVTVAPNSPISLIEGANSVISYQYSHVTGHSSNSSMIHCPLNPPPSPTTTTMQQDECSCRGYPVAGPTPCSTDVCDSEASYPTVNILHLPDRDRTNRNRSRRQSKYQQQRLNNEYQDMLYRSLESVAPPPPPPTPTRSFISDSTSSH